jgi:XTP/dITP diphosphohydrolase
MLNHIVVASHNPGKVREIGDLLAPLGLTVQSASALNLPEPEETEVTFAGNALLKARAAAAASGLPALSDDSGLCVAVLGGDPGVYSARLAGPDKDFSQAMQKVWAAVVASGQSDRSAYFICVLALAFPDGRAETFTGRVDGNLVWPPRGEKGFGYDPFFVPTGHSLTFAEMEPAAKHAMSHRAEAFAHFLDWLAQANANANA